MGKLQKLYSSLLARRSNPVMLDEWCKGSITYNSLFISKS